MSPAPPSFSALAVLAQGSLGERYRPQQGRRCPTWVTCALPTVLRQLADLNKRLPPEACLPPAKPVGRPARFERQLAVRPSTPHTITLQPSSFRNLRLPKRLRVVYFLARTRLAQRLIMVPLPLALPCPLRASTQVPLESYTVSQRWGHSSSTQTLVASRVINKPVWEKQPWVIRGRGDRPV